MKYDFDKVIDRANTFSIKLDLAEKRNKPLDAIPLWVADMDFPTAPCIQQALIERANHGIFGYSRPDKRYFTAVKNWFKKWHNFDVHDEWIVNTPGVVFAVATAIKAFSSEGDGVLIQKPVYYPFFNSIEVLNRRVVNSPLKLIHHRYEIDFEDFEQKIVAENVKIFILCSPHNPGGSVWSRNQLEKISEICLKHNVLVVSDEIHSDFVFEGAQHTVYANISENAAQNSIICTSPSKTFNLAGLQFSNIIIPNKKIRVSFKREVHKTGYDEPSLMGIAATIAAYEKGEEWFNQVKTYIWNNIKFAKEYIESRSSKIKVIIPEGSYLLWLDFSEYTDLSAEKIDDIIVNKAKVWLDDGKLFGEEGKKFQRINCATPRPILETALEKICLEFC